MDSKQEKLNCGLTSPLNRHGNMLHLMLTGPLHQRLLMFNDYMRMMMSKSANCKTLASHVVSYQTAILRRTASNQNGELTTNGTFQLHWTAVKRISY